MHQCARFSADPKVDHAQVLKWLGRYLRGTSDKGIFLKLTDDSFKVWADADLSGNYSQDEAADNTDTA